MKKIMTTALALALAACSQSDDPTRNDAPIATANDTASPPAAAPIATPVAAAKPIRKGDWLRTIAETPEGGYRMGNPDAAVKLVEYGARTCPSCAAFSAQASKPLRERYIANGDVSYEFRDYAVHGIPDVAAALAGRCGGPDVFFPVLERTYAQQERSLGDLKKAVESNADALKGYDVGRTIAFIAKEGGYSRLAVEAGVPAADVDRCVGDVKQAQRLVDMTNNAKSVEGTPTFIVNGRKIEGATWAAVASALDAEATKRTTRD